MTEILKILIAFLPIMVFLAAMWFMDSFNLVKKKRIVEAIFVGFLVALVCVGINKLFITTFDISFTDFSRFVAPWIEEVVKVAFIIYLIKANKVGFLVDAAIIGFAIGAGFAIIENAYYFNVMGDASLLTWFVRGFGTAIMHGGTVAIAAIISKDLYDRKSNLGILVFIPGLFAAVLIHSLFNMFIMPPVTTALLIIMILPVIFAFVLKQSEQNTRNWLGSGLDSDVEMLRTLLAGNISETRIGKYLHSIEVNFAPVVVGDIICYLRIYLELSIEAKGILIMKNSGIDLPLSPYVEAQLTELEYLEKAIGKTGKRALQPLLKLNNTDLWQLTMMRENAKSSKGS